MPEFDIYKSKILNILNKIMKQERREAVKKLNSQKENRAKFCALPQISHDKIRVF